MPSGHFETAYLIHASPHLPNNFCLRFHSNSWHYLDEGSTVKWHVTCVCYYFNV